MDGQHPDGWHFDRSMMLWELWIDGKMVEAMTILHVRTLNARFAR